MISNGERKIKFTFPILTLNKGGAQRMLVDITNDLVDSGHEVTILMLKNSNNEYHVRSKVIYGKNTGILTADDYPNSDVIVSNFYTTVDSAHQASQNGKGLHIRFSLCYEPIFLPDQHLSFKSYFKAPYLVILSKYQQELIKLLHGLTGQIVPIYVNPNFQNLNIRHQNKTLQISAIVRMPEGGWAWHRDQDYLLQQLTIVKNQFPHIQLNLICPPNEFAKSQTLQNINKNSFRFYTPANDQELCHIYSQSDIFVTSSIYEAAPLPGLEAMKCGAALAAIYAGGNLEYGRHEKNCLMSNRHESRLASDIIRLIENPELRSKLAKQGQQDAEQWTLKRSCSAFERICINALNDLKK
ncbi:glycosyltransferase family 4 protein [Cytobacillus oceanisediminis]|uniref:glycosyltransferase family 4 protein n=1 Tax=Cytobacillus oceanisediminis TaxID=665099 RepID=UPI001C24A03B|nr:glycosyltransferase family 4 protein [Cytobacillus oceanisediminis]MBU8772839.1 glycosyltransferase family 4 protein [Cytobacillus oceanisediminis]